MKKIYNLYGKTFLIIIGTVLLFMVNAKLSAQPCSSEFCPRFEGIELVSNINKCINDPVFSYRIKYGNRHFAVKEFKVSYNGSEPVVVPAVSSAWGLQSTFPVEYVHGLTQPGSFNMEIEIIPKISAEFSLSNCGQPPLDGSQGEIGRLYCERQIVSFDVSMVQCSEPGTCPEIVEIKHSPPCLGKQLILCASLNSPDYAAETIQWTIPGGFSRSGNTLIYDASNADPNASYIFTASVQSVNGNCPASTKTKTISFNPCSPDACVDCSKSFEPQYGLEYVVSGWVKEEDYPVNNTYLNSALRLSFEPVCHFPNNYLESVDLNALLMPSGPIIDGWQKIEELITVPTFSSELSLELVNQGHRVDVFFDDIRIHPLNSSMKTYAYDPETLHMMAELDENNFSTVFEYDEEGNLVRAEVETERGVKTVHESRQHQTQ